MRSVVARSSAGRVEVGAHCDRARSLQCLALQACRFGTDVSTAEPSSPDGSKRKCTESVASSSDNPTDLRRSDCHSESHQPRTLRARCKPHTRGAQSCRQGRSRQTCRKLRSFLFAQGQTAHPCACSGVSEEENGRAQGPAARRRFAEPGTLSSTFPTNLPLPRSAPRGASTYRRPVLGAAALYANPDLSIKVASERIRRNLRRNSSFRAQRSESGSSLTRRLRVS